MFGVSEDATLTIPTSAAARAASRGNQREKWLVLKTLIYGVGLPWLRQLAGKAQYAFALSATLGGRPTCIQAVEDKRLVALEWLVRAGFWARGFTYAVMGSLALALALGA